MKKLFLFLGLLLFALNVHASTNCYTGCDVDGNSLLLIDFNFSSWSAGNNDVVIFVKDSTGKTVAVRNDPNVSSWATTQTVDYFADKDGNYTIEMTGQGSFNNYNLKISFLSGGTPSVFLDVNCVGSTCGGGTKTYKFNVTGAGPIAMDDNSTLPSSVKGGTTFFSTVRFYDGHDCGGGPCDVHMRIIRLSDSNVVAYRNFPSWETWSTPTTLDWIADEDDSYKLELFYEGTWGQYDLNVQYVDSDNVTKLLSDNYQYIGTGLATGTLTDYFFSVTGAPAVLLDDGKKTLYKALGSSPFNARIRMYDGHLCGFGNCNASFSIKDVNGATVASVTTSDYSTLNNTPLQFNTTTNHSYYVEVWYEGTWVQFDLNVDYTDTTNVARHFEDRLQFIGSGLSTGNFAQYFFDSGVSCGDGITCALETCVPVILNGDSSEKIDIVFVGSDFPDLNTFAWVVEDMIDYDMNGLGIMRYSPFKENKESFNFWKVNVLQTLNGGGFIGPIHDQRYAFEADSLVAEHCGTINEKIPLKILLSVYPRFTPFAAAFPTDNTTWGGAYVTVGEEYLDECNFYDEDGFCAIDPVIVPYRKAPDQNINLGGRREAIQQVTVHEFGHAFGSLADEYDAGAYDIFSHSGQAPNCDHQSTCPKWSSVTGACASICGYSNWYKSYQGLAGDSMMSIPEHHAEFNIVSKLELEEDIDSYFTEFVSVGVTEKSYFMSFAVEDGNFTLNTIKLIDQTTSSSPLDSPSNYKLVLETNDGSMIYDTNLVVPNSVLFFPSRDWIDENGNQIYVPNVNPIEILNDFNAIVSVPHASNGGKIKIIDINNVVKLIVGVGQFNYELDYKIGFGGNILSSASYHVSYSIIDQPVGKITSQNYSSILGPTVTIK